MCLYYVSAKLSAAAAAIPLLRRGVSYSPPVEGGCLDRYARAIASRLYAAAKLDGVVFPI